MNFNLQLTATLNILKVLDSNLICANGSRAVITKLHSPPNLIINNALQTAFQFSIVLWWMAFSESLSKLQAFSFGSSLPFCIFLPDLHKFKFPAFPLPFASRRMEFNMMAMRRSEWITHEIIPLWIFPFLRISTDKNALSSEMISSLFN
jgi:hypothetical protein